mmetsp:Transcript_104163/g.335909  ORF Transcript_104163/g.335909 Transcript_104163/m.335909 type:complete len:282 (+) Transcript_104163:508-1353(+)
MACIHCCATPHCAAACVGYAAAAAAFRLATAAPDIGSACVCPAPTLGVAVAPPVPTELSEPAVPRAADAARGSTPATAAAATAAAAVGLAATLPPCAQLPCKSLIHFAWDSRCSLRCSSWRFWSSRSFRCASAWRCCCSSSKRRRCSSRSRCSACCFCCSSISFCCRKRSSARRCFSSASACQAWQISWCFMSKNLVSSRSGNGVVFSTCRPHATKMSVMTSTLVSLSKCGFICTLIPLIVTSLPAAMMASRTRGSFKETRAQPIELCFLTVTFSPTSSTG